ncbi:hypothetical protein WJX74_005219 [Apatococcus lobatus]|uniref:Hypoxanthine phosphoribosyltransferase n=1 Tax=Apatococcus lobatus TaxID=904363 RepID=A0AAW1RJ00_9CHLO
MIAQAHLASLSGWCKTSRLRSEECAISVFPAFQRSAAARAGMERHADITEVLFSEQNIKTRVAEMGQQLASDYQHKQPLVLGVLSGSFIFMADLVRCIQPPPSGLHVDFARAQSYAGKATWSSGEVHTIMGKLPIQNRHIILVEDIVDSGQTTKNLIIGLKKAGVASCALVALLNKTSRRVENVDVALQGFECPDKFVVGYGLDFDEEYRSLPFIGVLRPECYS